MTCTQIYPLVRALWADHPESCCLHVALADGNLRNGSILFCLLEAGARGHPLCHAIATKLLQCSPTQRRRIYYDQFTHRE